MEVIKYRGGVALVGDAALTTIVSNFAPEQDTNQRGYPLHITLLTKDEYVTCGKPQLPRLSRDSLDVRYLHALGLGQQSERPDVRWIVVVWYHVDKWRRSLGILPSHLHISITPNNNHNLDKSINSLIDTESLSHTWSEDVFDHILLSSCTKLHPTIAEWMAARFPESHRAFIRLADMNRNDQPKLSMLAYARAYHLDPSLVAYVMKQLLKLNGTVSWGPTLTELELLGVPTSLRASLLDPRPLLDLKTCNHTLWTTPQHSREPQWLDQVELPRFFSWILPNRLAGMSTPRSEEDIETLQRLGITTVLTLTKEEPLPVQWFEFRTISNVYVPVENWKAPTRGEMDYIYSRFIDSPDSVWLVHCGGGKGRAGTVLACLIAMHAEAGEEPTPFPQFDTTAAISTIRSLRPGSIESQDQEHFVGQWIQNRWLVAQSEATPEESSEPMTIATPPGSNVAFNTDVTHIFLVGLPGSGKSWLSIAIAKRRKALGLKTVIINQDTTRSRSACEEAIGRSHSPALVILDRCNPSTSDRQAFLSLLPSPSLVIAIHLSSPPPICTQRIATRLSHPTIPIGSGHHALTSMSRALTPPTLTEPFSAILTLPSFPASISALHLLTTPTLPLTKFPRTPHLLDLGATTPDDILSPLPTQTHAQQSRLTIEEKLDGANLGLSLTSCGTRILAQNRSHHVTSSYHEQFRPLDAWVATHSAALKRVLGRDGHMPDRWTLYGEWLVARHSVAYTSLPAPFLAFDLYDRVERVFVSRRLLVRALEGTGVYAVPVLEEREVGRGVGEGELRGLVQRRSRFGEGRVEGVYVRFEDGEGRRTTGRGKVVRGDFIQGDEHWTKRGVVRNGILWEGERGGAGV
ncbi:hypothetical protein BDZ85DRAFT_292893 [Elsinoe ampelina]|uniref:Tyrosine specific protein phosphatases domain-containing protein n=1 Tax=Elsinoe ampelina TaxID=302913 RepID=A0A6A6GR90_9PEZI|nr:hypothetical protein BDZ85DRAFT_292893 [Elsinoe ampelina]